MFSFSRHLYPKRHTVKGGKADLFFLHTVRVTSSVGMDLKALEKSLYMDFKSLNSQSPMFDSAAHLKLNCFPLFPSTDHLW